MKVFVIFAMLITFSIIFASSNIASGLPIPVLCEYHNPRINLTPTKEVFSLEEPIRVNAGTVPEDVLEVIVKDPKNMVIYSDVIKTDSSGDATIDIPIPQKPVIGTWEVFVISHSDESQKVVFVGVGHNPEPHLAINPYQITHIAGKNISATFLVAGESKQSASVKVFDSKGNNVYRNEVLFLPLEESCNYSIDIKGSESGEYTIALFSGNETASAEFNIGTTYGGGDSTVTIDLPSPLKQIENGISPSKVICAEGLILIQKYDGSPACVTESTKLKLVERGWTNMTPIEPDLGKIGTYELQHEGKIFDIKYHIKGGSDIKEIISDDDSNAINIILERDYDGALEITLPRELIDSKISKDVDDLFFVLIDEEEVPYTETTTDATRTLTIQFEKDSKVIKIIGAMPL